MPELVDPAMDDRCELFEVDFTAMENRSLK